MKLLNLVTAALICAVACPLLHAEKPVGVADWPSFRGANGHGSVRGSLPDTWSDADYAWRFALGSRDVGSVAIADGRVHLLAFDSKASALTLHAIALEGGASIWKKSFPIGQYHMHARNSYAASTPTVANGRIYISYADDDHTWLRCLGADGEEVWARDFGPWQSDHGFGTSPAVIGSLVLLYDSQQAEELPAGKKPSHERMIAVDAESGEDRWMTPLKATRTCYGIPTAYHAPDGSTQIIDAGTGNGLFGIDAKTGTKLWELPVFDKRVVSTPIVVGDIAIATCGSGGGGNYLVAVKIPADKTQAPEQLYRIDRAAPYVPTSAVDGEYLMMVSDNGIASRARVADGEIIWSQRIGGNFGASPIVVGDKALIISLDGTATVLQCGNSFRKLGEVSLGGPVGASPAYASGKLVLRVDDELRCLALDRSL
ncbi:MAG: PQQ-binding-like beta-propeller repeat protein [Planctomycetaceae bacterium]